jgi:hypothetical protein
MRPRPWEPIELEPFEIAALKAMARGRADGGQQTLVLNIIIEKLAGTYMPTFRPEEFGGSRATDYAEGARSVGLRIRHFITSPGGEYDRPEPEYGPNSEPTSSEQSPSSSGPQRTAPFKREWRRTPKKA